MSTKARVHDLYNYLNSKYFFLDLALTINLASVNTFS
jgi:hypothetical protein